MKKETKKYLITLPVELHESAKVVAEENGQSMSGLMKVALRQYLKSQGEV